MNIYKTTFESYLQTITDENRYRNFINLERDASRFPIAFCKNINADVVMWCNNDYLGMGLNAKVIESAKIALQKYGIGAGGTRNISGTSSAIVELEHLLAALHKKEQALVFSSGYVANQNSLFALAKIFKNLVFFSDSDNHASMIAGINYSKAEKHIFAHNNTSDLRKLLASVDIKRPKVIAFESIYSMDGSIAPIEEICALAQEYNAITYLDEVHAVALYGKNGGGYAQKLNLEDKVDIIQGTLGKGFGGVGGYIAAKKEIIEAVRHAAPGFIFTTALPPVIAAGLTASIKHLMESNQERENHQENVRLFKEVLSKAKIDFIDNGSHITPIMIRDARRAQEISQNLLQKHKIYVQHINYPTVPKGAERLRVIITPFHSKQMINHFVDALSQELAGQ